MVGQKQAEMAQRASTAEVVADSLMALIVSGELKAGEPLRETTLAKRYGVSRNSTREAIRLLERSRLVQYEMHRGVIVRTPTVQDLEDLFASRKHIELLAVEQDATPEQLEALKQAFKDLEESVLTKEPHPIIMADLRLHQSIVGLLGSERISSFYEILSKELIFYFTVLSYADDEYLNAEVSVVARHTDIFEAIKTGNKKQARKLLKKHIEENFSRLREILEERAQTETKN